MSAHNTSASQRMRVRELREQGFDIRTVWTQQATDAGVAHRIARYVLCSTMGGVL